MSLFGWATIIVDAILAVAAIVKWRHATTARAIGDVLIKTIETAPIGLPERKALKADAKMTSHRAGVSKHLHARVTAVTAVREKDYIDGGGQGHR